MPEQRPRETALAGWTSSRRALCYRALAAATAARRRDHQRLIYVRDIFGFRGDVSEPTSGRRHSVMSGRCDTSALCPLCRRKQTHSGLAFVI
jgi:hypothetical protein